MELRIYLGKNKSKSMTTVQWVKCMVEDLPGGGQKNWILKDKKDTGVII